LSFAPQSRAGPNPPPADQLSAQERLAELASILAAGLVRLRARQSSRLSGERENSLVDFTANQSGHAAEIQRTETGA
jgi:hypothetical protein